ncbi:MAG: hypothetical protein L3K03_07235 [Thermoplasmata archaeon]|nr:hypothetical protein [Thermoplasmata archaeon]
MKTPPCATDSLGVTISRFVDQHDTRPSKEELSWADLAALLSKFAIRASKSGPAWSPVRYAEGATRGNDAVELVYTAVMDVDDGTDPQDVHERLSRLGLEHLIHSTHSSTPEHPKFRVIVPFAEPIPNSEWSAIFPRLCLLLTDGHTDRATKDPSRIFFLPAAKPGGKTFTYSGHGRPVSRADLPTAPEPPSRSAPLPVVQVETGADGKIPHGRHHELIVSTAASLAARVAGISEAALVGAMEGALDALLDDLPAHRVEIREAARSAVAKFGRPVPAPATPGPGGSTKERRIEAFKSIRLQGLAESEALDRLEADGQLATQPGEITTAELLAASGLLDDWPIGWTEDESAQLAEFLTFEDVIRRLARVVDLPRDKLVLGILVAAQGHLAPLLRAIGPAIHAIPVAPRFSAGKTRTAHALTMLADGRWTDSATVPFLKSARKAGPKVLGIDEGDEAEKDSPGVKAYLLISHNWDAVYGKFSDPDEKGHRELEDIRYGGPIFLTFRKRPWPALESRSIIFEIEPSARRSVSDDGAGDGLRSLLLAPMYWLRSRCSAGLEEWDPKRALARIHEPEFIKTLDRVTNGLPILRQRDKARTLLFIAERLQIDLTAEIEAALREEEVESENATVIEAIERDPDFRAARDAGAEAEIGVEALRLRIQKDLRDHREFTTLTRNGFAAVLCEMEFSKQHGPTWREGKGRGRPAVIFPGLWARGRAPGPPSAPAPSRQAGGTGGTGGTSYEIARGGEPHNSPAPDAADLPAEPGSWMEGPIRGLPKRASVDATDPGERP